MKLIKERLKAWNKEEFGDINRKFREITERMEDLDKKLESIGLSDQELKQRRDLQGELWRAAKFRESIMHQKSRRRWIQEGDLNTHFFSLLRELATTI